MISYHLPSKGISSDERVAMPGSALALTKLEVTSELIAWGTADVENIGIYLFATPKLISGGDIQNEGSVAFDRIRNLPWKDYTPAANQLEERPLLSLLLLLLLDYIQDEDQNKDKLSKVSHECEL